MDEKQDKYETLVSMHRECIKYIKSNFKPGESFDVDITMNVLIALDTALGKQDNEDKEDLSYSLNSLSIMIIKQDIKKTELERLLSEKIKPNLN